MKIKMNREVIVFAAIIMVTMTIPAVMGQVADLTGVVANPGGPYSGPAGSQIQFDGSMSAFFPSWDYPEGYITSYEWDFGDGNIGTGVSPVHTYGSAGVYTVALKVTDNWDFFATETTTATIDDGMTLPANQPPIADANNPYVGVEGSEITFDASASIDPDGDALQYRWDFNNDETWDTDWLETPTASYTWSDDWSGAVKVEVSDGELTDIATANVMVSNVAPTINSITAPIDPVQVGTGISTDAEFSDPGISDTHTAEWDWGDGGTSQVSVTDGSGTFSGSHAYEQAGVYAITLTVTDDDGGSDSAQYQHYIVVYDPEGGFVTGGGWITSPAGAYAPEPSLTGKATFGFVSKYKKGATVPTGQTEFQFHVGNLNFHSTSYDWLVIAGAKAQYKGTGTINGAGNYGFMLTAIDEKLTPSTDVDMFRIKIWNKDNGDTIVYDNQLGADEDEDPTTAIEGGSIVIHKSK